MLKKITTKSFTQKEMCFLFRSQSKRYVFCKILRRKPINRFLRITVWSFIVLEMICVQYVFGLAVVCVLYSSEKNIKLFTSIRSQQNGFEFKNLIESICNQRLF